MNRIKNFIRQFIPEPIITLYHLALAWLANLIYSNPSEKLIVIGVTGTNGKSTTVNLISKILEEAGFKTAVTSTVNFKIGNKDYLNDLKMTMPGRFFLQRLLSEAAKQGCTHAVIESSSQGILQYRQFGIHYDVMVFTNLTPEHIEAHSGFENYKQAKLKYFAHLEKLPHKNIQGRKIEKVIVFNADDPYGPEFAKFKVDKLVSFGQSEKALVRAEKFLPNPNGISFTIQNEKFNLKLRGLFDIYNATAAVATGQALGIELKTAKQALEKVEGIPGRLELIDEGQNFQVIVDYAPEPESLKQLYATIKTWPHGRIIHVLGSTGGGRDVARRKILGQIAGTNADIVVVTNEDPYNDDPQEIIRQVADGAVEAGKEIKKDLFRDLDRRNAIAKALSMAQVNDLVLITGKGSEQKMAIKGGYIKWDDREVVREELQKLLKQK